MMMIEQPGMYDVICNCHSKKAFDHIGNRRYRVIVENHSLSYDKAKSKLDKGIIVTSILETIHNAGGNFIRKPNNKLATSSSSTYWEILSLAQAKEKIGHALRGVIDSQIKKLSSGKNPSGRNIYDIIIGSRGVVNIQMKSKIEYIFRLKEHEKIEDLANSTRPRATLPIRHFISNPMA